MARTRPKLRKVPQGETFLRTCIKTHARVAGFYEHCGAPQCSISCALRAIMIAIIYSDRDYGKGAARAAIARVGYNPKTTLFSNYYT